MKTLLKNGTVINVFTDSLVKADVLIENEKIIGVGDYSDSDADVVEDLCGKYLSPGFIDGHIHIESTMLTPAELARITLPCGTTSIVADPHEIANVCGIAGIRYMLAASEGIPLNVYFNIPSCVPATQFDESGAELTADTIREFYSYERVLGLAEMMNYPGVIFGDSEVIKKLSDAISLGKHIDGHAPLLSGKELDKYISAGVSTDHECSSAAEAIEKLSKGQWIMIREGTAARNLSALLPLFAEPYNRRCLLVTDDRHPADIAELGHIDNIIRKAIASGVAPTVAIRMATLQAAQCFGLSFLGAIAPAYRADIAILDDLNSVSVCEVYSKGKKVVAGKKTLPFATPDIAEDLKRSVYNSFNTQKIEESTFFIEPLSERCRVIKLIAGEIITDELCETINWSQNNGIDVERDILKLAVIERHKGTGHKGVGFVKGIGLKKGAIASSVSHDSHNIIVIGANDSDMAIAANLVAKSGGNAVVCDGNVISHMHLPIAGLMSELSGEQISRDNAEVRNAVYSLGVPNDIEPFMNMAFVSLPVIPALKMTTLGLFDVNNWKLVSLYL